MAALGLTLIVALGALGVVWAVRRYAATPRELRSSGVRVRFPQLEALGAVLLAIFVFLPILVIAAVTSLVRALRGQPVRKLPQAPASADSASQSSGGPQ